MCESCISSLVSIPVRVVGGGRGYIGTLISVIGVSTLLHLEGNCTGREHGWPTRRSILGNTSKLFIIVHQGQLLCDPTHSLWGR
jgi:hypothetical protein